MGKFLVYNNSMQNWQYRTDLKIPFDSGGYPHEPAGVIPDDTSWKTTNSSTISLPNIQYFFRDSNYYPTSPPYTANTSRVVITVSQNITVSFSSDNTLTATFTGTINSIVRDDIIGNPNTGLSTKRNIYIRQYASGPIVPGGQFLNLDIATAGTIGSNIALPSYTITLAPGENLSKYSLYVISCLPGHEGDSLPSVNVDAMQMGIEIKNIAPKDYRPGATWNGSNFMSHNRSGGVCNYWSGTDWVEMRTFGYPDGKGNPPLLYRDDDWFDMGKIGQE